MVSVATYTCVNAVQYDTYEFLFCCCLLCTAALFPLVFHINLMFTIFILVLACLPVYSQFGRTALHHAANSGKLECVKALVKEFGVDPDITDSVSI